MKLKQLEYKSSLRKLLMSGASVGDVQQRLGTFMFPQSDQSKKSTDKWRKSTQKQLRSELQQEREKRNLEFLMLMCHLLEH